MCEGDRNSWTRNCTIPGAPCCPHRDKGVAQCDHRLGGLNKVLKGFNVPSVSCAPVLSRIRRLGGQMMMTFNKQLECRFNVATHHSRFFHFRDFRQLSVLQLHVSYSNIFHAHLDSPSSNDTLLHIRLLSLRIQPALRSVRSDYLKLLGASLHAQASKSIQRRGALNLFRTSESATGTVPVLVRSSPAP